MNYLAKYKTFDSVKDMDDMVKEHVSYHRDVLTASNREVLYSIASHALMYCGAATLLVSTIAKEIGISERTVMRSTKILTDLGIIFKYKTVKKAGQGASIYVIAPKLKTYSVSHQTTETCQSPKEQETHVITTASTDSHETHETVTKNLSTSSFNPFVVKNVVNNVNACASMTDLKQLLRDVYKPCPVEGNKAFEELCKIAFGRLKQYMKTHQIPYLQMESIVIKCMKSLVAKEGVKNQFAMYSAMIKRQVEQLFEQPVQPVINAPQPLQQRTKEVVPDWFKRRNDERNEAPVPSTISEGGIDFEVERQKILAKIGG